MQGSEHEPATASEHHTDVEVTGDEVALAAVMGRSILHIIGRVSRNNPNFEGDAVRIHHLYSKLRWPKSSATIKSNVAAADALTQLPGLLILRRTGIVSPLSSNLLTSNNPWLEPTVSMLKGVKLYDTHCQPRSALRLAVPFLRHFYPRQHQLNLKEAEAVLPNNTGTAYRIYKKTAEDFLRRLPKAAPPEGVPVKQVSYFSNVTIENAAESLKGLLVHMYELDACLRECRAQSGPTGTSIY